jgi:neprilysin
LALGIHTISTHIVFHRTIANYMMWRASQSVSILLHETIRTRALEFSKVYTGRQSYEPRWKECVGMTSSYLPLAVSALYVRKYFSENSKQIAAEMVDEIKDEFVSVLKTVPWMDETTRAAGFEKVKAMADHIGYPSELMDDKKLIEYHEDLVINKDEYLKSVLKLTHFRIETAAKKFREKVNKTEWESHGNVAIANAYYNWIENSICELTFGFILLRALMLPEYK